MHRDRDARERSDSYARLPHNSPPALGKGRRQRQPVSGSWFTFVGIKPDIDPVRTRKKARALRALHWLASRSSEVSQLTARLRGSAATAGNLRASHERRLAEREGFEPPSRLPGKTLSRRPRYDHFGTSPLLTSLGGAPLDSPPPCALAVAFGDSPPALACGRRRFLLRSVGPL